MVFGPVSTYLYVICLGVSLVFLISSDLLHEEQNDGNFKQINRCLYSFECMFGVAERGVTSSGLQRAEHNVGNLKISSLNCVLSTFSKHMEHIYGHLLSNIIYYEL